MKLESGTTIALVGCPAFIENHREITISGLYTLDEFMPADRSMGIYSPGWIVIPADYPSEEANEEFFVECDDLFAQACPKEYGEWLANERLDEMLMEMSAET